MAFGARVHVVDDSIEITCYEVEIQTEHVEIKEESKEKEEPVPDEVVFHEVQTQTYHTIPLAVEHNHNRSMEVTDRVADINAPSIRGMILTTSQGKQVRCIRKP
jgi:hypothetical protein